MIDMRGSIDDQITIYGDELYDWAKIYQSLIGYDEILDNVEINFEYRQKMINIFEKYILDLYSRSSEELSLSGTTGSAIYQKTWHNIRDDAKDEEVTNTEEMKEFNKNQKYLENIKLIALSLLFSLIPLHNNKNCIKFYNLLENYI